MTADEVLKAIEARRDPDLKHHTNDDIVRVRYSEILVLEEAIDELRAERDRFAHEASDLRSRLGKSKSWHQAKQKEIDELRAKLKSLTYCEHGAEYDRFTNCDECVNTAIRDLK